MVLRLPLGEGEGPGEAVARAWVAEARAEAEALALSVRLPAQLAEAAPLAVPAAEAEALDESLGDAVACGLVPTVAVDVCDADAERVEVSETAAVEELDAEGVLRGEEDATEDALGLTEAAVDQVKDGDSDAVEETDVVYEERAEVEAKDVAELEGDGVSEDRMDAVVTRE